VSVNGIQVRREVFSGYGCMSFCNGDVLKTISSVGLFVNWIGVVDVLLVVIIF